MRILKNSVNICLFFSMFQNITISTTRYGVGVDVHNVMLHKLILRFENHPEWGEIWITP